MGSAHSERDAAARLPDGDIVALLLEQHARIRELFANVEAEAGEARKAAFDALRALLAVHEVAEEMVVRPVVREFVGEQETTARDREEAAAAEVLKQLEGLDAGSPEFQEMIGGLKHSVSEHADAEESQEFPALVEQCTQERRLQMGKRLQELEKLAPTHPHPKAAGKPAVLMLTGPFAAMLDRVRDAIKS